MCEREMGIQLATQIFRIATFTTVFKISSKFVLFLTNGTRKWGEKSNVWTFYTLTITTAEFYTVKLPSGVNYTATMRSVSKVIPSLTMQAAAPGWRQLLPSLKLPSRSHVGHLQAYSYTPVDLEYCSI